jgi:hypothetical protein
MIFDVPIEKHSIFLSEYFPNRVKDFTVGGKECIRALKRHKIKLYITNVMRLLCKIKKENAKIFSFCNLQLSTSKKI